MACVVTRTQWCALVRTRNVRRKKNGNILSSVVNCSLELSADEKFMSDKLFTWRSNQFNWRNEFLTSMVSLITWSNRKWLINSTTAKTGKLYRNSFCAVDIRFEIAINYVFALELVRVKSSLQEIIKLLKLCFIFVTFFLLNFRYIKLILNTC